MILYFRQKHKLAKLKTENYEVLKNNILTSRKLYKKKINNHIMSENTWFKKIVNSGDHWFKKKIESNKLCVTHNGGFFSCCSVRLHYIVEYFNSVKKLPDIVDTAGLFHLYKLSESQGDVTFNYFKKYDLYNNIQYDKPIDFIETHQFLNYNHLDFRSIFPFIVKYFSPSDEITKTIRNIEQKYAIDYDNTCVLFYRGNDKNRETRICEYKEYIDKANEILKKNPNVVFLIQSDETEFLDKMQNHFSNNSVCFRDEIRHIKKCNDTVDLLLRDNIEFFSSNFLAITIIMSKCKFIVCGSGNCSLWIMFYRGNTSNVYQNLNGVWINH